MRGERDIVDTGSFDPDERAATALGRLLSDAGSRPDVSGPSVGGDAWQRLGERSLLRAVQELDERSRAPRSWAGFLKPALAGALVVGLALGGVALALRAPSETLTFTLQGPARAGTSEKGVRVEGAPHQTTALEFSDGSRISVHAAAVAQVESAGSRGATLLLERGGLDADIVPRPGAQWAVRAGSYEVRVVGTVFTTLWDPESERLSVLLREGSVRVVGAGLQSELELRPGQRLDAGPGGSWQITPLDAPPQPAAVAEQTEPSTASAPEQDGESASADAEPTSEDVAASRSAATHRATPRNGSGSPGSAQRSGSETVSWTTLVNQGQFSQVLEQAKRQGTEACLARCSADDLRALADAARYSGEVPLAREALLALRARAPRESARAAYFLGSLSESRGQAASALEWYTRSLEEASSGPFAAEARAGRMRALLALGRREEARAQAREYLTLHPNGVAAERARQLASGAP